MEDSLIKINLVKMIVEFAVQLDECKGIKKITDDSGNVSVPVERLADFCHDIGILLGKAMTKSMFPAE